MKKYQIFISSTFEDLKEERNEIIKAILELNHIPCSMEYFPASNQDQWTYITKMIDLCDYYIVLIAGKYGSEDENGTIYTQKEYKYAIDKNIPVIGFLYKDMSSLNPEKKENDAGKIKKLENFKTLVQKKLCRYWENNGELKGIVSTSLIHLIQEYPMPGWIRSKNTEGPVEKRKTVDEETISELSTYFFANKVSDAFPGIREVTWYNNSDALYRLEELLKPPIFFKKTKGENVVNDPIWWFRGFASNAIEKFERLDYEKCLINNMELKIDKIFIFYSEHIYQQFVYVETKSDSSCGIYEYNQDDINEYGYCEEYGLYNGHIISRASYDDGRAVINGQLVDTYGAELRRRYLSKYNFIISAKFACMNSQDFEVLTEPIFNTILDDEKNINNLVSIIKNLPRHWRDNY